MSSPRVWLVTGSSSGLGREIALAALARGDKVVATARSVESIRDLAESYPARCRVLQLDVTAPFAALVEKAREAVAEPQWDRVDVLVNNAGWSLVGSVEESGAEGLMEMYKTNVFGAVNVTNAFLPHMRQRRSGTIVFIGSRSGWRTRFPHNGLYGSSKAAIHAIAAALSTEVAPFDIRVLTVVPGGLRTANIERVRHTTGTPAAPGFPHPAQPAHPGAPDGSAGERGAAVVPEYAALHAQVRQYLDATRGAQPGDPAKAAAAIVDVVRGEGAAAGRGAWPQELVLGSDAVRDVAEKCRETLRALEEWGDVARGVDV